VLAFSLSRAAPALAADGGAPAPDPAAPLPSKDVRWSATLEGAVEKGTLPRAAPGVALGLDVRRGVLAARVIASAFLPERDHAYRADVGLFDVMAMVCALAPIGSSFDLGLCGGGGAGLLRAQPYASASSGAQVALRPQGIATTRWDVTLYPGLVLSLEAGAVVDPLRTRLPLDVAGGAPRSSLVSFRGALAVLVRFW
jgi:hypothetical protein